MATPPEDPIRDGMADERAAPLEPAEDTIVEALDATDPTQVVEGSRDVAATGGALDASVPRNPELEALIRSFGPPTAPTPILSDPEADPPPPVLTPRGRAGGDWTDPGDPSRGRTQKMPTVVDDAPSSELPPAVARAAESPGGAPSATRKLTTLQPQGARDRPGVTRPREIASGRHSGSMPSIVIAPEAGAGVVTTMGTASPVVVVVGAERGATATAPMKTLSADVVGDRNKALAAAAAARQTPTSSFPRWVPWLIVPALVIGLGVGVPLGIRWSNTRRAPVAATPGAATHAPTPATSPRPLSPAPAAALGALAIHTVPPEAVVTVDGTQVGVTPLEVPMDAGNHTVVVKRERYADMVRDVVVPSGKVLTLELALARPLSKIFVSSTPANVPIVIDDRPVGKTPVTAVRSAYEQHLVQARGQGCRPAEHSVYLKSVASYITFYCDPSTANR